MKINASIMLEKFKTSSQQLLDLIFPKICVNCGKAGKLLCEECFRSIEIIPPGKPLCAASYKQPLVKKIVTGLKYDQLRDLDFVCARIIAKFLDKNGIKFAGDEIITFVPMHRQKQAVRGFNQAESIAQRLGAILELPCFPILSKIKKTPAQMTLNRSHRLTAVIGAYESSNCAGRKIILIDDVSTTGATLNECETALYRAGADKVIPLAFCKD